MSSKLHNYVRTYRRRSSLGQQDVAFLLGSKDRAKVCRYEQGRRLPSLRTALALAAILNVPIAVLFGGIQQEVQENVAEQIATMRSRLMNKYGPDRVPVLVSKQLRWLNDHHGRIQDNKHLPL